MQMVQNRTWNRIIIAFLSVNTWNLCVCKRAIKTEGKHSITYPPYDSTIRVVVPLTTEVRDTDQGYPAGNVTVRVATTSINPPTEVRKAPDGRWVSVRGFEYELLEACARKLNFRYRVIVPDDNEWGRKINGRWTGTMGLLQRNEADIAVCTLAVTLEKFEEFEISSPHLPYTVTFMVRAPTELGKETAIIRPFRLSVWIGIFISLFVTSFIFYHILKYVLQKRITFGGIFWSLFSYILLQDADDKYWKKDAVRLILSGWLFYAFIIACSYGGTLMALLTMPSYEKIPRNFKELAEASEAGTIKPGTFLSTATFTMLTTGPSEVEKAITKAMLKDKANYPNSFDACTRRVLATNYAFIGSDLACKGEKARLGRENFVISKDILYSGNLAVIMKRGFPFTQQFRYITNQLLAGGIIQKWVADDFDYNAIGVNRNRTFTDDGPKALTFTELIGPFYILLFGYVLSTICLLFERFIKILPTAKH